LRDPEGGELCVFEPKDKQSAVPAYRLYELVVDSAEPREIATWWADVLGGTVGGDTENGWAWIEPLPGAPFEGMVFVPVSEPKAVKNRIHWDVDTTSVDALVAHGASVLRAPDEEISWTVLADPEGNEFCAFVGD
ncbi:MAG: hypothetical protein M3237_21730, partial [Actinomycetota bacterium]|nr:hypothetical protein [Actinomycetota bacterium]